MSRLPFGGCFFDIYLNDILFASVLGIVLVVLIVGGHVFRHFPKLARPELEVGVRFSLVPKNLVGQLVALCVVVDDEAFIVFSALVHHLTKGLECGEHPRVVLVNALPVVNVRLPQYKNEINVGAQVRRDS